MFYIEDYFPVWMKNKYSNDFIQYKRKRRKSGKGSMKNMRIISKTCIYK
jgi:hypothetical protein